MDKAADEMRFHAVSAVELQLLLELVALAGFAMEKDGHWPGRMIGWLGSLTMLLDDVEAAERRTFIAARGDLLLQVLGLFCRAVQPQVVQQQDIQRGWAAVL